MKTVPLQMGISPEADTKINSPQRCSSQQSVMSSLHHFHSLFFYFLRTLRFLRYCS